MMMLYVVLLAGLLGPRIVAAMRQQAAGVEGQLMCGMKPASNVHVKLWEEDSGQLPHENRLTTKKSSITVLTVLEECRI